MAHGQIVYIRPVANENEPPNRIRELRQERGFSQTELARRANVTPSALNKLELGKRGLDQDWMRRLAPLLGVTPAELLPLADNPMILDEEERALLNRYRRADTRTRDQLNRVTEAVAPFAQRDDDAAA